MTMHPCPVGASVNTIETGMAPAVPGDGARGGGGGVVLDERVQGFQSAGGGGGCGGSGQGQAQGAQTDAVRTRAFMTPAHKFGLEFDGF